MSAAAEVSPVCRFEVMNCLKQRAHTAPGPPQGGPRDPVRHPSRHGGPTGTPRETRAQAVDRHVPSASPALRGLVPPGLIKSARSQLISGLISERRQIKQHCSIPKKKNSTVQTGRRLVEKERLRQLPSVRRRRRQSDHIHPSDH